MNTRGADAMLYACILHSRVGVVDSSIASCAVLTLTIIGCCRHVFCKGCLVLAVKTMKKCPTCRKVLRPNQIHRVYF